MSNNKFAAFARFMNEYSFTKKKFVTFSISCVTIQIFQEQEFQVMSLEQTCLSEPEHAPALDNLPTSCGWLKYI